LFVGYRGADYYLEPHAPLPELGYNTRCSPDKAEKHANALFTNRMMMDASALTQVDASALVQGASVVSRAAGIIKIIRLFLVDASSLIRFMYIIMY
jgi:hypothetical protein